MKIPFKIGDVVKILSGYYVGRHGVVDKIKDSEIIVSIRGHRMPFDVESLKLAENKMKLKSLLKENEVPLDNIDFTELEKEITSKIGSSFKVDEKIPKSGGHFKLGSKKNYVNASGVFKPALSVVNIGTFNAQYTPAKNGQPEFYWMTWDIFYSHKGGGSNGVEFMTAWYYPDQKKWEFRV